MSEEEKIRAYAFWTQGAEGGILDDSEWLRVIEPNTKLDSPYGPIKIEEQAHIDCLDVWKKGVFGHIDHDDEQEFVIEVKDAKYVENDGLYIKAHTNNKMILKMLKSGKAKPSVEIDIPTKGDYDGENRVVKRYTPTGIGVMVNGEALGENVGAFAPDLTRAIGGKQNMGEEGDGQDFTFDQGKVDEFFSSFGRDVEADGKKVTSTIGDYRKQLNGLHGEKEVPLDTIEKFVDLVKKAKEDKTQDDGHNSNELDEKYKNLLQEFKDTDLNSKKKDELIKDSQDKMVALEKILVLQTIEQAKSDGVKTELIDFEGMSFEEVKRAINYEQKRAKAYGWQQPDPDNPSGKAREQVSGGLYDSDNKMNDKEYNKMAKEFLNDTNKTSTDIFAKNMNK